MFVCACGQGVFKSPKLVCDPTRIFCVWVELVRFVCWCAVSMCHVQACHEKDWKGVWQHDLVVVNLLLVDNLVSSEDGKLHAGLFARSIQQSVCAGAGVFLFCWCKDASACV
jgi:hypothetical protein